MMNENKKNFVFVGGWLLGRPKGKLGPISADTSPGGFVLSGKPGGITTLEVDLETGEAKRTAYTGEGIPVGFMTLSPDKRFLYAAWEGNTYDGRVASGSCVYSYEICPEDGSLKLLNKRSSIGSCTNFLSMDTEGRYLFVSNHGEYGAVSKVVKTGSHSWEVRPQYDDASLVMFPIEADGSIGPASDVIILSGESHKPGAVWGAKGIGPHFHCVNVDPSDQLVIACDIEFARLLFFHLDKQGGRLIPCENPEYYFPPEIHGARHVYFHPVLPYIYVIADGLCTFRYDPSTGNIVLINRIDKIDALSMCLHPNGRFIYLNAGAYIYTCSINEDNGEIAQIGCTAVPCGNFSRTCCFDTSGEYLLVADVESDNIVYFHVDEDNGKLNSVHSLGVVPGGASIQFVSY